MGTAEGLIFGVVFVWIFGNLLGWFFANIWKRVTLLTGGYSLARGLTGIGQRVKLPGQAPTRNGMVTKSVLSRYGNAGCVTAGIAVLFPSRTQSG